MDPGLAVEVSALARMRGITAAEAGGDSTIQRAYRDATAFLTGGSGFLGKHFLEKLLRSTDVSKVYLLVRPKKGKTVEQRLDSILQDPLFDGLKKTKPGFGAKIVAIAGDISELGLGMSDEDKKLLGKEVNFIFHIAATTRFDEPLPTAIITNVRGTREVIALGKTCTKLRALVHISTAYSHATFSKIGKNVQEQFYEVPLTPEALIDIAERGDSEGLDRVMEVLKQDWPNTYCFTKAVAEQLLSGISGVMPACIVRPSIVISAYREPAPGWLDTSAAYGPAGVMLGVGLGLIHTMLADNSVKIDAVPADIVNNAVLAAGWATVGQTHVKIYTVSSSRNATTWGACSDVLKTESRKLSTPRAVWYCYCYETSNRLLFNLLFWLLHYIPAYFIDGVCSVFGKPRRFVKMYTKAQKLFTLNSYFTTNEWKFSDKNLQKLRKSMSETDRQIYDFDITCIDWKELMLIWCMGLRKYIVKDGLTGTDYAVKKQFWFRIANFIVLVLYAYLWWKLFYILYSIITFLL